MNIQYGDSTHLAYLMEHDHHVAPDILRNKLERGETLIASDAHGVIGWLRFGYFWDNTPFMNMLYIEKLHRGMGIGRELVTYWEQEMHEKGYTMVMTSTQSDEDAQHFYRKLGYKDAGSLLLPDEPLEIILIKTL